MIHGVPYENVALTHHGCRPKNSGSLAANGLQHGRELGSLAPIWNGGFQLLESWESYVNGNFNGNLMGI